MHPLYEALIPVACVMCGTLGCFLWGRRGARSPNPYREGLLLYDGALCAALFAGLRILGDKYVSHLALSAAQESFALLLLLSAGVLGVRRGTYADRRLKRCVDAVHAECCVLLQHEAGRLAAYRWTNVPVFDAGYRFALEHGMTELALKIGREQPPEWSAGFLEGCLKQYEMSGGAMEPGANRA